MLSVSPWLITINRHWQILVQGQSRYPIFRQELAYWEQRLGGRWHLEEIFIFIALANLCLLPIALMIYPNLLLAFALLDEGLTWFIALPSAALIVRERENQTWAILRSTPLDSQQIAVNKLGGLLSVIWDSAAYLVKARWLGTWLALPILALMLTLRNPFPLAASQTLWIGLGLVSIYFSFIYRPQLNLLYGGSLGLAISVFSRARGEAFAWVTLIASVSVLVSASSIVAFLHFNGAAPLFSESALATRLESIFVWLIPLGGLTLLRGLLTPVCLWLAGLGLQHLSD